MFNKNLKAFSSNPLDFAADFYVLGLRGLFKVFKKAVALALLLTFTGSQIVFAADPRELLAQAKAGFENPDQGRLGGSGYEPSQFIQSQSNQQNVVDQQNTLQEIQNLNFSLTTQNGDILNYVNNRLETIQTHDGHELQGITLNEDGTIKEADLRLSDGSIQVLQDGKILAYNTPDGTEIYYDAATGRIDKTIKNNVISEYTDNYLNGQLTYTEVLTDSSLAYYLPDGSLWVSMVNPAPGVSQINYYDHGKLTQIIQNGVTYLYNDHENPDGSIATNLAPDNYLPITTYDFSARDKAWRKFTSENSIGTSVEAKPIEYSFNISQKSDMQVTFDAKSFGNLLPSGYSDFTLRYFLDKNGLQDSIGKTFKVKASDVDWQRGELVLPSLEAGSYVFRFYLEDPNAHSGCESVASREANETPKGCELSQVNFKFKDIKFNALVYPNTDLPKEVVYNADRTFKKARLADDTTIFFKEGLPKEAIDKDGKNTSFMFDDAGVLGNVISSTINQNGLDATYDAEGKLVSVKLNDLTIHYEDSEIDYIRKDDGTELEGLTFDANGNILNATIITPDGEVRVYENAELKSLERQDTKIFYDLGKPLQLIQNDLTYDFTYTPEKITAVIASEPGERGDLGEIASSTTRNDVIAYEYDSNFNLKKVIRQNNEILSYLNNDIREWIIPNEAPKVFDYVKDAQGKTLSYTMTQAETVSYYDANNQIQKTIINATTENPHTLEVQYQYGKIRRILKDNLETFKYNYTFDPDGSEKTIIQDLEEQTTKTYKNSLLLTSFDEENSVLSTYDYVIASPEGAWQSDEIASSPTAPRNDRVHKVTVTRLGRLLHTYEYSYADNNTIVKDEEGAIRTYNTQNKLIFLEKDKQKWAYSYNKNIAQDLDTIENAFESAGGHVSPSEDPSPDEEIVKETLIQKTLKDNSVVLYDDKGQVSRINLTDGTFITDVVLNEDRSFKKAILNLLDGTKKVFGPTSLLEEITPEGSHLYYENQRLSKLIAPDLNTYIYSYDMQGNAIQTVWVDTGNHKLKYDSNYNLLGLKLNNLLDPDEIRASTVSTFTGSGSWDSSTGPNSIDGDFATAFNGNYYQSFDRTQGSGHADIYSTHLFSQAQTIDQIKYKIYVYGGGSGDYSNNNGASYNYSIEYQLGTNTWIPLDGHSRSYFGDTGIVTALTNLSGVTAIRAYAHGYGSGSDHGHAQAQAYIYELQYNLVDLANYTYDGGDVFSGSRNTIQYALTDNLYLSKINPSDSGKAYWISAANEAILESTQIASQEYSTSGLLQTQTKADRTVTVFNENNKPVQVLSEEGTILIEYSYDQDGNPSRVYLGNARDTLPDEITKATLAIQKQRTDSLTALLDQKNIAYQSIQSQVQEQKEFLQSQLSSLEGQYNEIAGIKVKGKKAKNQKGDALNQIGAAQDQVRNALSQLYAQESQAYEDLDTQVKALSDQIELDSSAALAELATQEADLKKEILRQEISPIVYDYYRRILGRDPSTAEYDFWVNKIDYNSGNLLASDVQVLSNTSMQFDGSGDYLSLEDSEDWNFGAGNFTMETWFNTTNTTNQYQMLASQYVDINNRWVLSLDDRGIDTPKIKFAIVQSGAPSINLMHETTITPNAWHHVAIVRNGNIFDIYLDGVKGAPVISTRIIPDYTAPLLIGKHSNSDTRYFYGQLDNFRISKGVARYSANFTPQITQYTADADTKLLLRGVESASNKSFVDESGLSHAVSSYGHAKVQKGTGVFTTQKFLTALKAHLNALPELGQRQAYVANIKANVRTRITNYLSLSLNEKVAFAQTYGLIPSEIIDLSQSDATKILNWLDTRSLHFGQSAFISLETLLDQKGIVYTREELATKCILVDILSGVISPLDDGDLVISVYALNRVAALHGLSLTGANLSWDELKDIYDSSSVQIETTTTTTQEPGAAMQFTGDGSRIQMANSPDFILGTGDFTIDAWINLAQLGRDNEILSQGTYMSSYGWLFGVDPNNHLYFATGPGNYWASGASFTGSSYTFTANTWHHVAVQRQGNTISLYVNGQLLTGYSTSISDFSTTANPLLVGASFYPGYYFKGAMDGVRISKGAARYTGNFVPQSERHTADAQTKLLLYADSETDVIRDMSSAAHSITTSNGVWSVKGYDDSLYFDGSGDALHVDDSNDWDFGAGDFTVEFYFGVAPGQTNPFTYLEFTGPNPLKIYYNNGIKVDIGGRTLSFAGAGNYGPSFIHFALVRNNSAGTGLRVYIDGFQYTGLADNANLSGFTGLTVGGNSSGNQSFSGRMNRLRISNVGRYANDFNGNKPESYVPDQYSKLILKNNSLTGLLEDVSGFGHALQLVGDTKTQMPFFAQTVKVTHTQKTITRYPATIPYPAMLTQAQKEDIINNPEKYNPRIIAHINGNHYVIVTGMTEDSITYIDPGIGKDKENESITVSKEGFLRAWKGNVALDVFNLQAFDHPEEKVLSVAQTQNIRGAFWGSLLSLLGSILSWIPIPGLQQIGWVISAVSTAVAAIEGDFLTAIGNIVTAGFQSIVGVFKGVFEGVTKAMGPLGKMVNALGQGFKNIYNGVVGFFNTAISFLPGIGSTLQAAAVTAGTTIGAKIVNTALSVGINLGISKGLQGLGVNPQIAGFFGSLAAGAAIGALSPESKNLAGQTISQTKAIQTSIQQTVTLDQVGRLGLELGLDTQFTSIIGLSLAAMQGLQITNPGAGLEAFKYVKPELFGSLAQYGVQKLGGALGLDPRISNLIGTPISSIFNHNPNTGVVDAVNQGILRGTASLGVEYLVEQTGLTPILGALASRAVTGAISGALHGRDVFGDIFQAFNDSVLNVARLGVSGTDSWSQTQYLQRVFNFSDIVRSKGLAQAMEASVAQVLHEDSITSILRSFNTIGAFIQDAINRNQFEQKTVNGRTLKYLHLTDADLGFSDDLSDLVEVRRGTETLSGSFGVDEYGNWGVKTGSILDVDPNNGNYYKQSLKDGFVEQIEIGNMNAGVYSVEYLVQAKQGERGINFDTNKKEIIDGILKSPDDSFKVTMADGFIEHYHALDFDLGFDLETGKLTSSTSSNSLVEPLLSSIAPASAQTFFDKARYFAATVGNLMQPPTYQTTMIVAQLGPKIQQDFGSTRNAQVQKAIDLFHTQYGFVPDIELTYASTEAVSASFGGLTLKASPESSFTFKGDMPQGVNGKIKFNMATGKFDSAVVSFKNEAGNLETKTYGSFDLANLNTANSFSEIYKLGAGGRYSWDVNANLTSAEQIKAELSLDSQTGRIMRNFMYSHELTAGSATGSWKLEVSMDKDDLRAAGIAAVGAMAILGILALSSEASTALGATATALAGIAGLLTSIQSQGAI